MSAFSHYFKDVAVVYYVTMTPYTIKSSSRYDVCLGALVLAYFLRATGLFDVHQVHTIIGFPTALLHVVDIFGCPLRR